MRRNFRAAALLLAIASIGCSEFREPNGPGGGGSSRQVRPSDQLPARADSGILRTSNPRPPEAPPEPKRPELVRGSGQLVGAVPPSRLARTDAQGEITLNFVNAEIGEVAASVLGDILAANYSIDPGIQGTVTIQTNRPILRSALVPALAAALRPSGVVLVEGDGAYRLASIENAHASGIAVRGIGRAAPGSPGYGAHIVPLRFVSAESMQQVLEPLAPRGSVLRADRARNVLILAGSQQEVASLLETIAVFDVDWLAGMSFAVFPLRYVEPKQLIGELEQAFLGQGSPIGELVRLIPLERMNAILAISAQGQYLERLRAWVERLDRANETTERRLFVYYVQNGRAVDLANVLARSLTGSSASNRVVPGRRSEPPDNRILRQRTIGESSLGATGSRTAAGTGRPAAVERQERLAPDPEPGVPVPSAAGPGGTPESIGISDGYAPTITADEINNALLVLATPREYEIVESALRRLDIIPLQVIIEAAIAEVTLTRDLRYGVQYFFQFGNTQIVRSDSNTITLPPQLPGFSFVFASGSDIRVILDLLDSVTNVNVISSPQLMVLNNQTATLQVGDEVPIATQSAVSIINPDAPIVNTIQFRDTGVILKVTPRVNEGGLVLMDISQEVSDVAETTTSGIDSPTIQQRKINSTVAIQDGATIALGGLIRDSRNRSRSGIPGLQDLPLVGALFRGTNESDSRTELLVLITPRVIRNQQDATGMADELRRRMRATKPVFERIR